MDGPRPRDGSLGRAISHAALPLMLVQAFSMITAGLEIHGDVTSGNARLCYMTLLNEGLLCLVLLLCGSSPGGAAVRRLHTCCARRRRRDDEFDGDGAFGGADIVLGSLDDTDWCRALLAVHEIVTRAAVGMAVLRVPWDATFAMAMFLLALEYVQQALLQPRLGLSALLLALAAEHAAAGDAGAAVLFGVACLPTFWLAVLSALPARLGDDADAAVAMTLSGPARPAQEQPDSQRPSTGDRGVTEHPGSPRGNGGRQGIVWVVPTQKTFCCICYDTRELETLFARLSVCQHEFCAQCVCTMADRVPRRCFACPLCRLATVADY